MQKATYCLLCSDTVGKYVIKAADKMQFFGKSSQVEDSSDI